MRRSSEANVLCYLGNGLVFAALFILAIAWRAVREERVLRAELGGYEDYTARVRYRLLPFVW